MIQEETSPGLSAKVSLEGLLGWDRSSPAAEGPHSELEWEVKLPPSPLGHRTLESQDSGGHLVKEWASESLRKQQL